MATPLVRPPPQTYLFSKQQRLAYFACFNSFSAMILRVKYVIVNLLKDLSYTLEASHSNHSKARLKV